MKDIKPFESELIKLNITDFWDYEDENGISMSGPYGLEFIVKGFIRPKSKDIIDIVCASKIFSDISHLITYSRKRIELLQDDFKEALKRFKPLINEEFEDPDINYYAKYKYTFYGKCISINLLNKQKYEDDISYKFTPYVITNTSSLRSLGNEEYSKLNRKDNESGTKLDWFFLMKDHKNDYREGMISLVNFLELAIEDLEPAFSYLDELYNDYIEDKSQSNKILSKVNYNFRDQKVNNFNKEKEYSTGKKKSKKKSKNVYDGFDYNKGPEEDLGFVDLDNLDNGFEEEDIPF